MTSREEAIDMANYIPTGAEKGSVNTLERIRTIATKTRHWAEDHRDKGDSFFPPDLEGMCAIVAQELFCRLQQAGIPNLEIAVALDEWNCGGHCFVIHDGKWIVDCTATQFGLGPVVIADRETLNHWHYQRIIGRFLTISALRKHLRATNWPMEQIRLAA